MDPALVKQRDAFKKRAMAVPTVEKRKAKSRDEEKPNKKARREPPPASSKPAYNYKTMSGSSQNNFGILAKIVKHMKERHKEGATYPLSIEEILDETNQTDLGPRQRHWLSTEALVSNPKVEQVQEDNQPKYKFKPKHNIKDKKALLRLLDKNDQQGMGGILKDDIEESLPNAQKVLKNLGDQILFITRPDKKQVLYYNDKSCAFTVEEEIQKLWRGVTVEGVDERKIEEYLQKQGITSMQDIEVKRATQKKRKGGKKKMKATNKDNLHMKEILKDFSESANK